MYEESILPRKLRTFNYYYNKLPLFLRNSYGFVEHFKIWYDLTYNNDNKGIVNIGDLLLYLLNIFDKDYLETINNMEDSDNGNASDILDKIGLLFGVSRKFSVTYLEGAQTVHEELSLNNEEFLILIKCQIIKNYCNGSEIQIQDYYESAGLNVYVLTSHVETATCYIHLAGVLEDPNYSNNIKAMFKAGLLRIESMGITYKNIVSELSGFLIWDSVTSGERWDEGVWTI